MSKIEAIYFINDDNSFWLYFFYNKDYYGFYSLIDNTLNMVGALMCKKSSEYQKFATNDIIKYLNRLEIKPRNNA